MGFHLHFYGRNMSKTLKQGLEQKYHLLTLEKRNIVGMTILEILEKSIIDNKFDINRNIQFVNFSDYSLYTLKDGKVESEYIKSLIKKITDKSEMNVFYQSYQNNCVRCVNKDKCPIKSNYELLSEDKCQDAIVNLLVQCIIKNKIM